MTARKGLTRRQFSHQLLLSTPVNHPSLQSPVSSNLSTSSTTADPVALGKTVLIPPPELQWETPQQSLQEPPTLSDRSALIDNLPLPDPMESWHRDARAVALEMVACEFDMICDRTKDQAAHWSALTSLQLTLQTLETLQRYGQLLHESNPIPMWPETQSSLSHIQGAVELAHSTLPVLWTYRQMWARSRSQPQATQPMGI